MVEARTSLGDVTMAHHLDAVISLVAKDASISHEKLPMNSETAILTASSSAKGARDLPGHQYAAAS